MKTDQPTIKKDQRVRYNWKRPYDGYTPGTVIDIRKKHVIIRWDDGKITRSSFEWVFKNTEFKDA